MKIEPYGYITKDDIPYCHRCFSGTVDETKVTAITDDEGKYECVICKQKIAADMPQPKWGTFAYFNTMSIEKIQKNLALKGKNKIDINEADPHGVRPIFHVLHTRRMDVIELMIAEGVNLDLTNQWGQTPYAECLNDIFVPKEIIEAMAPDHVYLEAPAPLHYDVNIDDGVSEKIKATATQVYLDNKKVIAEMDDATLEKHIEEFTAGVRALVDLKHSKSVLLRKLKAEKSGRTQIKEENEAAAKAKIRATKVKAAVKPKKPKITKREKNIINLGKLGMPLDMVINTVVPAGEYKDEEIREIWQKYNLGGE